VDSDLTYGRSPQLADYLSVLRARRGVVIGVTLLFVLAAGAYAFLTDPVYVSRAQVTYACPPEIDTVTCLETQVFVAKSPEVASRVIGRLRRNEDPETLLERLSVDVIGESAVLVFSYVSTDPVEAQKLTQALANSYTQLVEGNQATERENLEEKINDLRDDLAAATGVIEKEKIRAKIRLLSDQLAAIPEGPPAEIISPASTPERASIGTLMLLISASILGLIAGSILAFVLEGAQGHVRESGDVERELEAPVLGVIPYAQPGDKSGGFVATRDEPGSPVAEAYRLLRSGLLHAAGDGDRVVMVTSADVADGKSTTAANLGVALALAGHPTILVGGDLRRPDLHTMFGVPNERGLVQVLQTASVPQTVPTRVDGLRMLPSGPPIDQASHLFETGVFPKAIATLRNEADFVIIDAPPLAVSDPLLMAPHIDMLLLVVDSGKATRRSLRRTKDLLQRIGLPHLGVALNKYKGQWGPSGTRAYYYYRKSATPSDAGFTERPPGGNGQRLPPAPRRGLGRQRAPE
jgi:non-specific protein-tyrosine kinase